MTWLLGIMLLSFVTTLSWQPQQQVGQRYYCLAPWVWFTESGESSNTSHWAAPRQDILLGLVDLRPLPTQARSGGVPQGVGFFAYNADPGNIGQCFSGNLDTSLSVGAKIALRTLLNLPASLFSTSIRDILWELLTEFGDPTGVTRWKPLMPTSKGVLELHLGGHSIIKSMNYRLPKRLAEYKNIDTLILQTYQENYRAIRAEALAGQLPPDQHRKYLSVLATRHQIPWQLLIPAGLPQEPPVKPSTTISENFNQGDSTTLGPQLTWTELTGDWQTVSSKVSRVNTGSTLRFARADTDLSTDDHEAQIDVVTFTQPAASNNNLGAIVRKDSSATLDLYDAYLRITTGGVQTIRMEKVVAGVTTNLAATTQTFSIPDTVKIRSDGSTITDYRDGTQVDSLTDTSVVGNLRTGLVSAPNSATEVEGDNFSATDIGAAAPRRINVTIGGD